MSCLCCKDPGTVDEKKNTFDIHENNIINNDNENINGDKKEKFDIERYKNKNALEKIKKIQSEYRSHLFHELQQNRENLKQVKDEYEKIIENENKINNYNNELKQKLEKLNKEKYELLNKIEEYKIAIKKVGQENLEINEQNQLLNNNIKILEKQLKEQLKNAQVVFTDIKNKNSQLRLKYGRLSLAEKYAEEKQRVINELKENQYKLQTENNILKQECDRLNYVINSSNKAEIETIPISLKKMNTKLNKKGKIMLESKDIRTYPKIRLNNKTITKTGGRQWQSIYQAYQHRENYFKNNNTNNSKISNVNNKQELFNKNK